MTAQELIANVEAAIGALRADYRGHATESDLYEAALLAIGVAAARAAGGTTMITDDLRTVTRQVRFRCSPGNLWSRDFTFVVVDFPTTTARLELHLGVMVIGSSGVAHECDVALITHNEATRSRVHRVHPRASGLVAAIEAKNYAASPGLGVGRAFLGLGSELQQNKCNLAFPALSSTNISRLIARKGCECFDELTPRSPAADRLSAHLEQRIRNWVRSQRQ
jgi:hypothetical protein